MREVQKSLDQSVKRLLENKIQEYNAGYYFDVQRGLIKAKHGDGRIIFTGMQDHTADSIKSLEGYKICFVEEAQGISAHSLKLLRPTFRAEDSEMRFVWNPRYPTDPVDALLRGDPPPGAVVHKVNWRDNPFFPKVLLDEMMYDKGRDYEQYLNVWEGEYETAGEARVFKNYSVQEFTTPEDAEFLIGLDFGFAVDPTAANRCFVVGRKLYIDYEAHSFGCEIEDTPALLASIPDAHLWPCCADSARPETIRYMQKHGYPKMVSAVKGKNSVREGIAWLKSFDIVIHPRCVNTIDEFNKYSLKKDRQGVILPIPEDANNHHIDAIRYACESYRRRGVTAVKVQDAMPMPSKHFW